MKAQTAKRLGALSALAGMLLTGTACGAAPAKKNAPTPEAITAPAQVDNPEMQAANDRVQKASEQLDLARKQLSAAKSLLKAAEADLKAARADRDSVSMRYQAQGLAEQAGMPVQAGRAVATPTKTQIADRGVGLNAAPPQTSAPLSAPTPPQAATTAQSMEMNALPQTENDPQPAPNLQLR